MKKRITDTYCATKLCYLFLWAILFFGLAINPGYADEAGQPTPATIAILKSIDISKRAAPAIKTEYLVDGYFVVDPVPILVKDMRIVLANTPMRESDYIILDGPGVDRLRKQENAGGALIRARGRLLSDNRLIKGRVVHSLRLEFEPEVIERNSSVYAPTSIILCEVNPQLCAFPPPVTLGKYALLYSGGVDQINAHIRYWNDLKFMYLTLRSKYGYPANRIIVLYKNGVGEDKEMPVSYSASADGMKQAMTYLGSKMTGIDNFFVFMTNHGGGYHDTSCNEVEKSHGGRADGKPGDEVDKYHWDEQSWYYNQVKNDLWDDDFAKMINGLKFNRMVAVFEQCFSGGFLRDLRGANRVLISAATEFQFSWGGAKGNHDVFSYHFTSALNKADHTGAPLPSSPDADGNGRISVLEAFLYAKSRDTSCESPQLEDSGDGVGTSAPSANGKDGQLAAKTYF